MEFNFPQSVRIGLGVAQQVGLAARELGTRALVLSEPLTPESREKLVLGQILDRAGVRNLGMELLDGQPTAPFAKEAQSLAKSGFAEMVVTLGSSRMLSLGRKVSQNLELPLVEIPTNPVQPYLLRREGWCGSGTPTDWELFEVKLPVPQKIFLDPYLATGATAMSSVAGFLEMVFLALEAMTWDGCDPLSHTLGETVLKMWPLARQVYDQPTKAEFRTDSYFSGLALAQLLAQVPRGPGLTTLTLLRAVTKIPPHAGGAVLLPHFVEKYLWKRAGAVGLTAARMGFPDAYEDSQEGAEALAQEIRKSLSSFRLPLRFQELGLIESETSLCADMVRGADLRKGFALDGDETGALLRAAF